jgi:hypothetical protein
MMPRVASDWWTVANDPDLGQYTSAQQQLVDFGIWQAADGTWQLWSCIRGTQCGGVTRIYHSRDPADFGVNNDAGHLLGSLPVAAPEILRQEGRWYIASLLATLKGIRLAKLEWVEATDGHDQSRTLRQ